MIHEKNSFVEGFQNLAR